MKLPDMKTVKCKRNKNDFKAIHLKLNDDSIAPHSIYFKEHSVREHTKDKPSGRTIFVVNIPPYADKKGLINAFSSAGTIQSVELKIRPNIVEDNTNKILPELILSSFRVAYIVFEKVAGLDRALALTSLQPMNNKDHQIKCGMEKWIQEYNNNVYQPTHLKEKIEQFMESHDEESKKAEEKEKELAQEDEEGWVTVTKRGKVQSFARTEKVESKIMAKEEKNKKRKELKNFYTFQIRESKMKHIVALRQKFEEDKRKIAQIKEGRRFKPF